LKRAETSLGSHSSRGRREQRRHRQEEEGEGEVGLPGEVDSEHTDCSLPDPGRPLILLIFSVFLKSIFVC
jgi:hypothetical protein